MTYDLSLFGLALFIFAAGFLIGGFVGSAATPIRRNCILYSTTVDSINPDITIKVFYCQGKKSP